MERVKKMNSAIWIFVLIVILILAASEALIKDEDNDDFDPDDFLAATVPVNPIMTGSVTAKAVK